MRRTIGAAVAATVLGLAVLPVGAAARRLAPGKEKTAIIAAIRAAHDISAHQTASCMKVYVSTVNPNWATMEFLLQAKRCESQAANGIAVIARRSGRWHFVTAGSDFSCPIPGHIPMKVQRDLNLDCSPGS